MIGSLVIRVFQRHPVLLGVSAGLLLTVAIAAFAPAEDLKPGDSRILMAFVGAIVLVPGCIATVYAGRFLFNNIGQLPILRRFWIFAILFFTMAVSISTWNEWKAARRYAYEGRAVEGRVIETHPEDHDRLLVAYTISNVPYRTLSSGPRVARSYNPGEAIKVYYYSSAPAAGFCTKPQWRPDMAVASWLVAAGVLPVWMIGLVAGCKDVRARLTPHPLSADSV